LKTVVLPGSITQIGNNAFSDCNAITTLKVGWDSPPSTYVIDLTEIFENASRIILVVPQGYVWAYCYYADYCLYFKEVIGEDDYEWYYGNNE
jgi:hypothetical protein